MNVLFLSSEVAPFAKTGGLADVAGSLPQALRRLGHDVRVVTPAYRSSREAFRLSDSGLNITVPIGGLPEQAAILQAEHDGVPVYFLDHPGYFDRPGLYGPPGGGDHPDNAERFGFFCRGALELCKALDFAPQVVHGNDWQSGLAAVLLRSSYRDDPFFHRTGTLLTIHNLGYQGHFPADALTLLGLDPGLFTMAGLEFYDQLSFLKGGIVFSDVVTTVSDTYCREIQTPEYGHGFDGILRQRHNRLFGILNGINPADWDPRALPEHPFDTRDLAGKAAAKAALQRELGLAVRPELPLMVMVSRLDLQKGFDLIEAAWDELLQRPLQIALLGSGDPVLAGRLAARAAAAPERVALTTGFNEALSRRYYAGGDLFLMPSRYEPCGLSQLIALRYATLPLVRHTGGLADTIVDADLVTPLANGFSFTDYTPAALLACVDRGLKAFAAPERWRALQLQALQCDFSWEVAAHRYQELYHLCCAVPHE